MRTSKINVGDVFHNKKYGYYEILAKSDDFATVKFKNTGFVCEFHRSVVHTNNVKDYMSPTVFGVGYLGAPTKNDLDPVRAMITKVWHGMMVRCYNPSALNKRPTYRDCTISDSWKNLQNFKSWFLKQIDQGYYQDGWEIDKDLLVLNNTVYGEDTCVFLPQRLNQLQQVKKESEHNWLPGVNFDKARGKFKSEVNFDGKRYYLPRRETELESFLDYKDLKEKLVREDSVNWKNKIRPEAYEALSNYSLDWVLNDYLKGT